ncbi:MAG: DUF4097 family beta strand repeat protein [Ignavibacteriaceae bacterium]|nr:DUF4097 family beta strand repeat protein [Ignavibacteriaceae bacterium]
MRTYTNFFRNAVYLFVVLGLLIPVNGDSRKVALEEKFTVKPGELVSVDAAMGDVIINTWDKNEVYVKILASERAIDKMEFSAERTSSGVRVVVKKRGSFMSRMFDWGGQDIRLEIGVPRSFNTDVSTSGGDIKLKAVNGELKLRTSGGDVDIFSCAGDMKISTSGGDIKVNGFKGASTASTSGGDINIDDTHGDLSVSTSGGDIAINSNDGKIKASTSGGDIRLNYNGVNKGINLASTGGDIMVTVPADTKAYVKLTSTGGDIDCSLNISKSVKISSSRFEAEVNGGGEEIRCSSTGGDVSVKAR